jgi:hypothetical protein
VKADAIAYPCEHIKEYDKIEGEHMTHGRHEKCIKHLVRKAEGKTF